jgi:hypothetical protein
MNPKLVLIAVLTSWGFFGALLNTLNAGPDELKAEAAKLMERARDLKAEGRVEESQEHARKAKQLEAEARALAEPQDEPPIPPEDRLREKLQGLLTELKELDEDGREQEADRVRQRIGELKALLTEAKARGESAAGPQERRARLRREITDLRRQDLFETPENLERKLRASEDIRLDFRNDELQKGKERLSHLRQAIDHLHAAGMHEPAERLEQEATRMKWELANRFEGDRNAGPLGGQPPPRALEELKAQVSELRESLRETQRGLEETRSLLKRRLKEEF